MSEQHGQPVRPMDEPHKGEIYARIARAAAKMPPVPKSQVNTGQNYKFRGITDLIGTAKKILAEEGITVIPQFRRMIVHEIWETSKGAKMTHVIAEYAHNFVCQDGSGVTSVTLGEGMDSGDKACNKALSASLKYALNEVLFVAYDIEDADESSPQDAVGPAKPISVAKSADDSPKISPSQLKKLNAAIKPYADAAGKTPKEVKDRIKEAYKLESTKDMTVSQFDAVIKKLEG